MQLLRSLKGYPYFTNGAVVAIGNFDGVHLGHQHLLQNLRSRADAMQLPMVVVIFEPQAREFFMGHEAPPRIAPLRDKLSALQECGVDYVLCLRFNTSLANMQAHDFAEKIIFKCLNAKYLLVGRDFKFGKSRLGNFSLLNDLSKKYRSEVQQFHDFNHAAERVSSTIVRKLLKSSKFSQVANLLGRKYSISGRVIRGESNARKWGFPTANLNITQLPLVLRGVYCVQIKRKRGNILSGVANIGRRPTVSGNRQILEVHIFDFNDSLYGEELEVFFIEKIRDEKKFTSIDDLIARISQDITLAKEYFLQQQEKSDTND